MIIQLSEQNINDIAKKAAETIKSGGIVIMPFDTVYGIACDPYNFTAVERIIDFKNRPENKTIGLAVADVSSIETIANLKDHVDFIKDKTPGRFTFILDAIDKNLSPYCYKNNTIGVRIPDNDLVLSIIEQTDGVIAQTSANKSGMANCYSLSELKDQFSESQLNSIDLVIDGGEINKNAPSTLFDLTKESPRQIERN